MWHKDQAAARAGFALAEEVDAHHAKFVAGHKTGMSDRYVLRSAANQKMIACCGAIEEHFFCHKDVANTSFDQIK